MHGKGGVIGNSKTRRREINQPVESVPFPNSSSNTSERAVQLRSARETCAKSIMNAD